MIKRPKDLQGLLFIGDPHLSARNPEFRSDDYANVILEKINWCLSYASKDRLLPIFLGDLFDRPRNNPTWMINRLIEILIGKEAVGIYGNHDCAEPTINENDSLSILINCGCIRLLDSNELWKGIIGGRTAVIGGSSYRQEIPDKIDDEEFDRTSLFPEPKLGIWVSHHDVMVDGYEAGKFPPFEIQNIDVLVNGHIHTRGTPIRKGATLWFNPGSISRRSRSDLWRTQLPSVLRIDVSTDHIEHQWITIPHAPFEEVFFEPEMDQSMDDPSSLFVSGLSELRRRKTSSGAGLMEFLERNLEQFNDPVAEQIRNLATEINDGHGE